MGEPRSSSAAPGSPIQPEGLLKVCALPLISSTPQVTFRLCLAPLASSPGGPHGAWWGVRALPLPLARAEGEAAAPSSAPPPPS